MAKRKAVATHAPKAESRPLKIRSHKTLRELASIKRIKALKRLNSERKKQNLPKLKRFPKRLPPARLDSDTKYWRSRRTRSVRFKPAAYYAKHLTTRDGDQIRIKKKAKQLPATPADDPQIWKQILNELAGYFKLTNKNPVVPGKNIYVKVYLYNSKERFDFWVSKPRRRHSTRRALAETLEALKLDAENERYGTYIYVIGYEGEETLEETKEPKKKVSKLKPVKKARQKKARKVSRR